MTGPYHWAGGGTKENKESGDFRRKRNFRGKVCHDDDNAPSPFMSRGRLTPVARLFEDNGEPSKLR